MTLPSPLTKDWPNFSLSENQIHKNVYFDDNPLDLDSISKYSNDSTEFSQG